MDTPKPDLIIPQVINQKIIFLSKDNLFTPIWSFWYFKKDFGIRVSAKRHHKNTKQYQYQYNINIKYWKTLIVKESLTYWRLLEGKKYKKAVRHK